MLKHLNATPVTSDANNTSGAANATPTTLSGSYGGSAEQPKSAATPSQYAASSSALVSSTSSISFTTYEGGATRVKAAMLFLLPLALL